MERVAALPGGPLLLAQVLEGIQLCEHQRALQQPSLAAFLAAY